jgi:hypothetical protein
MKLTTEEQQGLIPDGAIHTAFLERDDIASLPPEKQEEKWKTHLEGVNRFRDWLTNLDSCVVAVSEPL